MPFKFKSERGEAAELNPTVESADGNERESTVIAIIQNALEQISHALGGHLTFSAQGYIHDRPGKVGDNLNIQVNSLLPPAAPVQDAGLAAAAGSPRNFPPESSTAAPQTSDGSPPAAQPPVPQPDPNAVPPTTSSTEPLPLSPSTLPETLTETPSVPSSPDAPPPIESVIQPTPPPAGAQPGEVVAQTVEPPAGS